MKKFNVMWKDTREVSIIIFAESEEDARQKWEDGEWEDKDIEINDQDVVCENGEFLQIEEDV
ncbi:hypothetical protein RAK27_11895 [Carnobacterium maltaromaticum]|uniref:Uncharacterized protein n=1 Tax=Carnobacterium maltaromaticum TaxID=2751 RepID=A0AAW9K7Z9_CARML|nr:hypothetical protein [Carnobacterium maltaromaticum]MDZ5759366.1 hypothetical protein [Carnobacterium maltaromaticum]